MRELLRRLKISYMIYNFFHKKQLMHNVASYKSLGLSKKYYSPVSSKDFSGLKKPVSISNDAEDIRHKLNLTKTFQDLSEANQQSLMSFPENGFAVLKHFFNDEQVEKINKEIDSLLENHKVKRLDNNKIMFAYKRSKFLTDIGNHHELKELLSALLGNNAILFQSINFLKGSEQHTHSDSIHMTTYPEGGLLGVWIALEDIRDDNGPLHYYPGSHKLPYYLNADYENEGTRWLLGDKLYEQYEKMIEEKIKQYQIKKGIFFAEKGDLLIWHANLFHGGEPHINKNKTRKSMVFHYFRQGDVCYHEITQRPALMDL